MRRRVAWLLVAMIESAMAVMRIPQHDWLAVGGYIFTAALAGYLALRTEDDEHHV